MATSKNLPVDAVSTVGIIMVLACILPAKALTQESLKQCTEILESLCGHSKFDGPLLLIPEHLALSLQSSHSKLRKQDVIGLLTEIGMDPNRHLSAVFHYLETFVFYVCKLNLDMIQTAIF